MFCKILFYLWCTELLLFPFGAKIVYPLPFLSFYLKAYCWIHDSCSFCLTGVPAFYSCLFFFVPVACIVMKLYKIWLFQPRKYAYVVLCPTFILFRSLYCGVQNFMVTCILFYASQLLMNTFSLHNT